jgi:hypothetical protein
MKTTIVGLIYKSPIYLDFMMEGIRKYCLNSQDTGYLIVANNPSDKIISKLSRDNIYHIIYKDSRPTDYYLNRVYRAWNYAGRNAQGDVVVFINSDMAFSKNWLENLLARLDRHTLPCSRLVESGKLRSGKHAIGNKNFGRTPATFDEKNFLNFAESISSPEIQRGGLFMPCAFYRDDFINSGGYPEGNIYSGGPGAHNTKFIESGDSNFFYSNKIMKKKQHITVFDSIVYHIQEGEKDE